MNVVDSSCWLEYFAGTATGKVVAEAIENTAALVVPVITLFEVFKKLLTEAGEDNAIMALAHMKQGKVVDLDAELALHAARIGIECKLPLADSVIYATALQYKCLLWTQDQHFRTLPEVRYFTKEC